MKKSLVFVFLFLFGVFYSGFSQGTWTVKKSLPATGRLTAVAFSIGTKGYLGTGNTGSVYTDDFWEYDPSSDSWAQKANFPGGQRAYSMGFSIGNKGYLGTGTNAAYKNYNDFWEYDPSLNIWSKKADLPGIARAHASGFSVNGFGYLGTGYDSAAKCLNDFWKYDPILNAWTQMNPFPGGARADIDRAWFVIGTKGYWGLGYGSGKFCNDFWEYDSFTDTWTQKANFPSTARYGATGFSLCNSGYLGLGANDSSCFNDFWKYNPANNSWIASATYPLSARGDQPSFVINNKAYVGTGTNIVNYCFNDWAEFADPCVSSVQFTSSDTIFCAESGSCIDFTDQSTYNPATWKWYFPGAVPDTSTQQNPMNICYYTPGTYAVTLIVSNSNGSDSLTVSPMITFATSAAAPVLTRSNDTIFCSHAAAYQWYFNGSPISNATDSFYVATGDGVYAVQITDGNGCTRLSSGFAVAVGEMSGLDGVRIYPNPAEDELTIDIGGLLRSARNDNFELSIYNVLGENVLQYEVKNQKSEINISSLRKGIYFIELNNGEKTFRTKMVKE